MRSPAYAGYPWWWDKILWDNVEAEAGHCDEGSKLFSVAYKEWRGCAGPPNPSFNTLVQHENTCKECLEKQTVFLVARRLMQ